MLFSISTFLLCSAAFCILRVSSPGGSFPRPLSAEQEAVCIQSMLQGDAKARETLIEHNLRLVAHIVKKYYSTAADSDDLISIGTIGLIKGVSTFNPEKNVRLATYISRCIENAMLSQMVFSSILCNRPFHNVIEITQKPDFFSRYACMFLNFIVYYT